MKWVHILIVAVLAILVCWFTGLIDEIAGPFEAWLKWIGA